uniref:Uncharacterized protein n=1 Tax=Anguilla anguilla TaxID=7936 RepID=A0A0E9RTI1_ANGAN
MDLSCLLSVTHFMVLTLPLAIQLATLGEEFGGEQEKKTSLIVNTG